MNPARLHIWGNDSLTKQLLNLLSPAYHSDDSGLAGFLACHSRACLPREAALAVLSPFVATLLRAGSARALRAEAECSRGGRNYGRAETLHGVYPERSRRVQGGRSGHPGLFGPPRHRIRDSSRTPDTRVRMRQRNHRNYLLQDSIISRASSRAIGPV
jgi:hypothetical protein